MVLGRFLGARWLAAFLCLLVFACAHADRARADGPMDALYKAAKAEGVVVVHGPPGKTYAPVLTTLFEKKFPGVRVRFKGDSNRTALPRLFRERKAGEFLWDVWLGGPDSILRTMKPRGAIEPLRPILLAETVDDSKWLNGFADGWMDREKQYVYAFDGSIQDIAWVNYDFIPRETLRSATDLLKPEFRGKIVFDDPRTSGAGNGAATGVLVNYGEDFLRKLYGHGIVPARDRRQIAEWVLRGRYPIGIGLGENELEVFWRNGMGKNIVAVPVAPGEKIQLQPGFGSVALVNRAPHPNAAKLYINWLLSADGQAGWNTVPRVSRRLDVPCKADCKKTREMVKAAGRNYFLGQQIDTLPRRDRARQVAKEVLGK